MGFLAQLDEEQELPFRQNGRSARALVKEGLGDGQRLSPELLATQIVGEQPKGSEIDKNRFPIRNRSG